MQRPLTPFVPPISSHLIILETIPTAPSSALLSVAGRAHPSEASPLAPVDVNFRTIMSPVAGVPLFSDFAWFVKGYSGGAANTASEEASVGRTPVDENISDDNLQHEMRQSPHDISGDGDGLHSNVSADNGVPAEEVGVREDDEQEDEEGQQLVPLTSEEKISLFCMCMRIRI